MSPLMLLNKSSLRVILLIVSLLSCSGCVGLVVAAATVGGVVILKGQTLSAMERDHHITTALTRYWYKHKPPHSHLVIETYHGIVLLVGQVSNKAAAHSMVNFAHSIAGVRRVYNEITPSKTLTLARQSKDTWITAKVKSRLLTEKGLNSTEIKVITSNGIVYLMGIVTPYEGKQASNSVRKIQGVKRVTVLFQYRPEQ